MTDRNHNPVHIPLIQLTGYWDTVVMSWEPTMK